MEPAWWRLWAHFYLDLWCTTWTFARHGLELPDDCSDDRRWAFREQVVAASLPEVVQDLVDHD